MMKRSFNNLDRFARLMDSQFRIPGTQIRFGLDALIGIVPGFGDFSTFVVSGFMVLLMARNGASGFVLARMILNIVIDGLVGSVPILGDLFDVAFKANQRNMKLMHEHYNEGKHRGSALKLILPLLLVLLLILAGIVWLMTVIYSMIIGWLN